MKEVNFKNILFFLLVAVSLPFTIYLVGTRTSFWQRAFGINANLYVDLGNAFISRNNWKNLAQGGEEEGRMLASVVTETAVLKPEYIRIDHVYDWYGAVNRNGTLTFDWRRLDETIDDIVLTGAKPFISLSYMPSVVTGSDVVGLPRDWDEWEYLVQKMIEHVSGEKQIADVYYEVWNEPDLFGGFKLTGEKSYLDLYRHSVSGASRAVNVLPFKIGGPALSGFNEDFITGLVNEAVNNGWRLDFISWHRYSKNLDSFVDEADKLASIVTRAGISDLELIISESGHNSENDKLYDQTFSAVYTLGLIAALDDRVDRLFTFEIKDGPGPEKLWGRWGLLTHEKFGPPEKKPRYKALEFVNQLTGENLNVAGEGTWVKAVGRQMGNKSQLMVVNFDPYNRHYEAVPIKLANLTAGQYLVRRTDFLGTVTEKKLIVDTDDLSLIEDMDANSAFILEIQKW